MPTYDVTAPLLPGQPWNLVVGPGMPPLPRARLVLAGPAHQVAMGVQANVALNAGCVGIYTDALADCSAFAVLYRDHHGAWSRASLIHILGGPDPNAVNWPGMVNNMPAGGIATWYAILANSRPTILTDNFLQAITANLPAIPAANTWVYNGQSSSINFGVDSGAFAGQTGI